MLAKNISDEIGALSFEILVLNPPASTEQRDYTQLWGNFSDLSTTNCKGFK